MANVAQCGKGDRELLSKLVEEYDLADDHRFPLFQRIRVAMAMSNAEQRKKLLVIRLMSIAVTGDYWIVTNVLFALFV